MAKKKKKTKKDKKSKKKETKKKTKGKDENTVFVGNKPAMNYVLAVVTQFHDGSKEVAIKARGRAISRAVDVAEIVRSKFLPEVELKDIIIGTEKMKSEGKEPTNVSTMEIYLEK